MAEGTIKWFDARKRYGYIEHEGESDLFVHINQWRGVSGSVPQEGDKVAFDEGVDRKGRPEAQNVRPIGTDGGYRFLNPYNFVCYLSQPRPSGKILGDCPPPSHDRYLGLTGRITCQVKAITPLFISDSHDVQDDNGHKTYRFFEYEGRPALPASSLRGMFRSVFEAVTNSCFVVFQEDRPYPLEHRESRAPDMIPARVVELDDKGARLELLDCTVNAPVNTSGRPTVVRAGAVLRSYPPRVLNQRTGRTFSSRQSQLPSGVHDGMRVAALVTRTPVTHRSNRFRAFQAKQTVPASQHQSLIEDDQFVKVFGWLHLTGPNIENKHDERLFFRWDDKQPDPPQIDDTPSQYFVECTLEVIAEYNHHLAEYWDRLGKEVEDLGNKRWPQSTDGVPHPSTFVEKGRQLRIGDLVYVGRDRKGKATMLRSVSMPRVRYSKPRQALLPGHFKRCDRYDDLCLACRVFGWVHENPPEEAMYVAYAGRVRFSHGRPLEDTIQQLDEPITLAILSTPKPTTTLFYLLGQDGQPADVTYDTQGARLRGRKMYRHHGASLDEREYQRAGDKRNDQNRTVQGVLKPGATFEFTLEFENMAEEELGALLWALELDGGAKMFHRLGFAKPLGFGSVKVQVTGLEVMSPRQRYTSFTAQTDGWQDAIAHKDVWKQKFTDAMQGLYGSPFAELDNIQDLRALLSDPAPRPIHYPRSKQDPDPDGKNYEWFMGNKKRKKPLPLAVDDTEGFPIWDRNGNKV